MYLYTTIVVIVFLFITAYLSECFCRYFYCFYIFWKENTENGAYVGCPHLPGVAW